MNDEKVDYRPLYYICAGVAIVFGFAGFMIGQQMTLGLCLA